jgi:DNA-directed RNA polymerase specialized sigma24 family protein
MFEKQFFDFFEVQYPRVFRFFDRLTGEPESAVELAKEAFARFYQLGAWPDDPIVELLRSSVGLLDDKRYAELFHSRVAMGEATAAQPSHLVGMSMLVAQAQISRDRTRAALNTLGRTERVLLLLHADGFRYNEIGAALSLDKHDLAIMLADARTAFHGEYHKPADAS